MSKSYSLLKHVLFFLILFSPFLLSGQNRIDIKLIKQKKIRKTLVKQNLSSITDFEKVKTACLCDQDTSFNKHIKSYLFPYNLSKVWEAYQEIQPSEAWNNRTISFGMMYEGNENKIMYANEIYPKTKVGQLIYINLHLFHGIINVAVAHKIMEINLTKRLIRTCYVDSGKSKGTQFIYFYPVNDHQTRVVHQTYFKSDSKFRDKFLYPSLHEKIITEFHNNVSHYLILKNTKAESKEKKHFVKNS